MAAFQRTVLIFCFIPVIATAQQPAQVLASSVATDSLRLDDVIKEVVHKNDKVAAARFMEKAAYAKVGPAGAWDDPMLMVGVANLPTSLDFKMDPMTMKMIGISQNVPYAGQKGLASKATRAEADATRQETRGVTVDLVTAAKYAFFDLYYRRLNLQFIEDQRSLQQDVVSSATAKLRTDQASQADVSAAQADLWRLDSDILSARQELQAAENDLIALMGFQPGTSLPPLAAMGLPEAPSTADFWLDQAKQNYPPLQRLKTQSRAYAFSASTARRMRWPMLGLSFNYGIRESTDMEKRDNMIGFQANISLPIFSGRQQAKMALSMDLMKQSADAEANQMWRDMESGIRTLQNRAQSLSQSYQLYQERIIPADQDAYRSAFTGYAANRVPFASLLIYASAIYRDRITANQIAYELARVMAQAEQYTTNPDRWLSD